VENEVLTGLCQSHLSQVEVRLACMSIARGCRPRSVLAASESVPQMGATLAAWVEQAEPEHRGARLVALLLAREQAQGQPLVPLLLERAEELDAFACGGSIPPWVTPPDPAQGRIRAEKQYESMVSDLSRAGLDEATARREAEQRTGHDAGLLPIARRGPPRRPEPPKAA